MRFRLGRGNKLYLLLGLFVAVVIIANLLGTKITTVFGVSVSVGIFMYPLTFLITDIVSEVYGPRKTRMFILTAFIALLVVLLYTLLSVWLPPAARFTDNDAYVKIFSFSIRLTIASIIAFLISQFHDIWAFHFLKRKTKGRHLWLRNNASTIVSQFIDTMLFTYLAFYMLTPDFTVWFVFTLAIPYWLLKIVMAIIDTPLCYLGVWWLKGKRPKKN